VRVLCTSLWWAFFQHLRVKSELIVFTLTTAVAFNQLFVWQISLWLEYNSPCNENGFTCHSSS